jgi:hypothetical protein
LSLTNLSTKRQRIAKLARTKRGVAFHLRDFLDRRVTDGVSYAIRERSSSMKNRKREICTSGSVRGEGGNILTYSAARSAAAWPLAARAQQGDRVRRIGVLQILAADDPDGMAETAAFLQGLGQLG